MKFKAVIAGCAVGLLLACSPPLFDLDAAPLTPAQAIAQASQHPEGSAGLLQFEIKRADRVGPRVFIDSEFNYQDPKSLNVAIPLGVAEAFQRETGISLTGRLEGRQIRVAGELKRVKIAYLQAGTPTGKYYFQTHLLVDSAKNIRII